MVRVILRLALVSPALVSPMIAGMLAGCFIGPVEGPVQPVAGGARLLAERAWVSLVGTGLLGTGLLGDRADMLGRGRLVGDSTWLVRTGVLVSDRRGLTDGTGLLGTGLLGTRLVGIRLVGAGLLDDLTDIVGRGRLVGDSTWLVRTGVLVSDRRRLTGDTGLIGVGSGLIGAGTGQIARWDDLSGSGPGLTGRSSRLAEDGTRLSTRLIARPDDLVGRRLGLIGGCARLADFGA
jgi:hypothetical protein